MRSRFLPSDERSLMRCALVQDWTVLAPQDDRHEALGSSVDDAARLGDRRRRHQKPTRSRVSSRWEKDPIRVYDVVDFLNGRDTSKRPP